MTLPDDEAVDDALASVDAPPDDLDHQPSVAPPTSRWRRAALTALRVAAVAVGIVALVPAISGAAVVTPYVMDDVRLDRAVRVAALDWRDQGDEAGRTRLQYELDHAAIGMQVRDDDCVFEGGDRTRAIRCAWGVTLVVPGTDVVVPLAFSSEVELLEDGSLR
jgi:hypothetical protein